MTIIISREAGIHMIPIMIHGVMSMMMISSTMPFMMILQVITGPTIISGRISRIHRIMTVEAQAQATVMTAAITAMTGIPTGIREAHGIPTIHGILTTQAGIPTGDE